jgi:ABC-type nitrate/sulfonate/bicarbonate transport system substrate-binding protein
MKKAFSLTLLLILIHAGRGLTQAGMVELNVNYPAIGGLSTALWVAVEAKTFEKYGVKVNPIYIPTSALAVRAMLAGELPIGLGAGKPIKRRLWPALI